MKKVLLLSCFLLLSVSSMEAQRSRQVGGGNNQSICVSEGIVGWNYIFGVPVPVWGCTAYMSADLATINRDKATPKERTKILTDLKTGSGSLVA
ncbi:hypothetical protein Phi19:1_gp002 [Cellulophaga phage phi19:1]|uniref:Uncharacterized protein n=1 Tax=Cellulophaga phage phi19:1 TaxID=1327970 RepID=R9ZY70_9CAUD|nr:hypothetical protein Phi19:1_gp002 [Cellulophaga phage phi19:1]AGO47292.1 hypothetical protein Phi19:1_gp002 [Cellulophaga phage phi19:1]